MATSLEPGQVLADRFHLVRRLGQGAVGSVWLAKDSHLDGESVACKVLNEVFAEDRRAIADLKREVLLTRRLRHPNIVAVYTFWETDSRRFITMEYIEGHNLAEMLAQQENAFTLQRVLPWVGKISEALDHAHSEEILHRDVKPANVMIRNDGRALLADFGIARTAREARGRLTGGLTSGTVMFMSPEQLMGEALDSRSDLYSLAASVYELLSGHPPFYTGSVMAQIQLKAPKPIEGIPPVVNTVLLKALSKDQEQRQPTCGIFFEELQAAASDMPTASGHGPRGKRPPHDEKTVHIRTPAVVDRRRRLGRILVEAGKLSQAQLDMALRRQEQSGQMLGKVLVELQYLSGEEITRTIGEQLRIEYADLEAEPPEENVRRHIPRHIARGFKCVPVSEGEGKLIVAVADPLDLMALNELEATTGLRVELRVATESGIEAAIERLYG